MCWCTIAHEPHVLMPSGRYLLQQHRKKGKFAYAEVTSTPPTAHQILAFASPPLVWLIVLPTSTIIGIFTYCTWFATPCSMVIHFPHAVYYHPSECVGRMK
ncbi:hypothetical protein TNCV_3324631 [Trichonephila clavipes]|nr:hypothetical protein TNCV_3324631 [Trichonephila clavipes]